ncbi:hypothetical protein M5X17_27825 [Paenibacillus alvei]|uniref:hypothetical protein n=1 Tax=Paenibacillus alvei TaxID=44250 RepID=UPI00228243F9|nr:hypothetical protein [Paenibacillus alvei]MCY9737516.1 hypothetical protein [Paenibacillus alvei]
MKKLVKEIKRIIINLFTKTKSIEKSELKLTHEKKLENIVDRLCEDKFQFSQILPEKFRTEFIMKSYIAGGCIYSLYHDQEPKDYDYFLKDKELAEEMKQYFLDVAGYRGNGISGGIYKDTGLIVTDNAISIGNRQIIIRETGTPEEVVGQFDFKHNMFYCDGVRVHTLSDFQNLKSDKLVYNEKRARDVCGTVVRVNKFVGRGMKISNREMSKILLELNSKGFSKKEVETLESGLNQSFSS